MRKLRIWLLFLIGGMLLLGATLASGASDSTEAECDPGIAGESDPSAPPVAASIETTLTSGLAQAAGEACLDCHSDKERVQELAVEDEPAESLSEGPG